MEQFPRISVEEEPKCVVWCDGRPCVVSVGFIDVLDFDLQRLSRVALNLPGNGESAVDFAFVEIHHIRHHQFLMLRSYASDPSTEVHELYSFTVNGVVDWQWTPDIPFESLCGAPVAISESAFLMSCGSGSIIEFDEERQRTRLVCDVGNLPFPEENAVELLGAEAVSGQVAGLWMSDWNVVELGIWTIDDQVKRPLVRKTYTDSHCFSSGSCRTPHRFAYMISTDVLYDFCVYADGQWTEASIPDEGRYHVDESLPFLFNDELYFFSDDGALLHFDFGKKDIVEVFHFGRRIALRAMNENSGGLLLALEPESPSDGYAIMNFDMKTTSGHLE